MKTFRKTILATSILLASSTAQAYTLQYTDTNGDFFTLDQNDADQAQYFADSLSGFGDPAAFTLQMEAMNIPVSLADTINGWRQDIAQQTGGFDCPYCVIELVEHSSYQTTETGSIFMNVSNLELDKSNNPTDLFFTEVDTYIVSMNFWYTAEDIGNPGIAPVSAVPIPAAAWLFGSGLIGMVGVARRKSPMDQVRSQNKTVKF